MEDWLIYEGKPLDVNCNGDSVNVNRNWNPDNANSNVGSALEVVSQTRQNHPYRDGFVI